MIIQEFRPVGTDAVELAVASALTSGSVTTVRIYIRSIATIVTPTTFITLNSLESEVVSRAGLPEATEFTAYVLVRTDVYGTEYVYVLDATVSDS
jgi:hypothetical protein